MFRPFRPTLETLEKREVFSTGPLVAMPLAIPEGGIGQPPAGVYPVAARVEFNSMTRPFADGLALTVTSTGTGTGAGSANGTYDFTSRGPNVPAVGVRVASADLNGDGVVDSVVMDYREGGNFLLPYLEQDNLYKFSSAHDRLFAELGSGNDLWSRHQPHSQILIGMILP